MGFTPGRTNNDDGGLGYTRSSAKNGIVGRNDSPDRVPTGQPGGNGIFGFSITPAASGVFGVNDRNDGNGVVGASRDGRGLMGISDNNIGIFARGGQFAGVFEGGSNGDGAVGPTRSSAKNGIVGRNDSPDRVPTGQPGGNGIFGFSITPAASGVFGVNDRNDGNGVVGASRDGRGLMGISDNNIGIFARGGQFAGVFEGTVSVSRDILLTNSDCAEDFDISEAGQVEPGTVMVLNEIGEVQPSNQAYDKKVAGIVSGAGNYKPALVLDKKENSPNNNRLPIALIPTLSTPCSAAPASWAARPSCWWSPPAPPRALAPSRLDQTARRPPSSAASMRWHADPAAHRFSRPLRAADAARRARVSLESFLFAVALAVGLTPELLPMVMTVTLARGAMRMAARRSW